MTRIIDPVGPVVEPIVRDIGVGRHFVVAEDGEFSPLSLENLELWLDPNDESTITLNGSDVAQWDDKSGNGNDFSQGTAALQPAFLDGTGINSKNTLDHSVSDEVLDGPDFLTGFTAGNLFLILEMALDPPTVSNDSGRDEWGSVGTATHHPFTDSNIYDGFASTVRKSTGNPTDDLASPHLYEAISTSAEWTSNINGTQHFTTATNTVGWTTAPKVGGGQLKFMVGQLGEVILCSSKQPSDNRSSVQSYMTGIWGVP